MPAVLTSITSEIALNKGEARLPVFHQLPGQKNISRTFQALSPEYEEPCSLRLNQDGEENLLSYRFLNWVLLVYHLH